MRRHGRRRGCEIKRAYAGRTTAWSPAHGFSMLEMVVALAVVGLALAIALPTLSRTGAQPQNLAADVQDLALNVQVARDLSTSRGIHYRLRVTSTTSYALEYQSGGWNTERAINVRANIAFPGGDVGKVAEFDTRGTCVSTACATPPLVFTLSDVARGWSRQVQVYTRGLVDRP